MLLKEPSIDPRLIEAFHDLRQIGNIGAHREKDVNLIRDVTPIEAEHLIIFIEHLITLSYIQEHQRQENYEKLKVINQKNKLKKLMQRASSLFCNISQPSLRTKYDQLLYMRQLYALEHFGIIYRLLNRSVSFLK